MPYAVPIIGAGVASLAKWAVDIMENRTNNVSGIDQYLPSSSPGEYIVAQLFAAGGGRFFGTSIVSSGLSSGVGSLVQDLAGKEPLDFEKASVSAANSMVARGLFKFGVGQAPVKGVLLKKPEGISSDLWTRQIQYTTVQGVFRAGTGFIARGALQSLRGGSGGSGMSLQQYITAIQQAAYRQQQKLIRFRNAFGGN